MFSIDLPKWAALPVQLPTGGTALMVHVGGGRFVSKVPPIVLAGVSPDGESQVDGLPIEWDGTTLPGDKPAFPVMFGFDVKSAGDAVDAAAAAGDTFAKAVLVELEEAAKTVAAQEKLGMVQATATDAGPAAEDVNAARTMVGLGPLSA